MIARVGATIGAVMPVAAYAVDKAKGGSAIVQAPVIWFFFGYPFEAAGMIAALFGCFAARFWIGAGQQLRQEHRWSLDFPVSAVTLAFAAMLVIAIRPAPFGGLLYGAGAGMLGEGIFTIAEHYMKKIADALGGDDSAAK